MSDLITKENRSKWLSNKSEAYVNGWISCENGDAHSEFNNNVSNFSETEYGEYIEGYSQCFSNQACVDNITQ